MMCLFGSFHAEISARIFLVSFGKIFNIKRIAKSDLSSVSKLEVVVAVNIC